MSTHRIAAALCALLLATSCANLGAPPPLSGAEICAAHASLSNPALQNGGVGGTGQVAQRPGIGGTGVVAEGGIGGTGIVGIITGFASICVNGVEVHYDPSTPVLRDGQAAPARELAVGQVVAVRAGAVPGTAKDQLQAQRIAVIDAAVGPLSRVDPATGELELLGQRATALERSNLVGLKAGDWVRVSGHRLASGEIRASRVQGLGTGLPAGAAQGTVAAQVMGPVAAIQGVEVRIGSTPVRLQALPAGLALGQELAVSGSWNGRVLQAQSTVLQPTRAGLGEVREVVLQGYVHAVRGRELVLGYESLQLSEGLRIGRGGPEQLRVGQHVQVSGRVGADRRITAERLEFSREGSRSGSGKSADDSDDSDGSSGQGRGRGRGRSGGTSGGDDSGGSSGSGSGKGGSGSGGSGGSGGGGGNSGSGSSK